MRWQKHLVSQPCLWWLSMFQSHPVERYKDTLFQKSAVSGPKVLSVNTRSCRGSRVQTIQVLSINWDYMIQCICIFSGFCLCKWLFSVLDWCCRQGGQNLPGYRMVKWIQRIWFWNYRSKHAEFYFSHFDWLSVFLLHIILTLYVQVLKSLSDEIGESLLASLFRMIFPH